MTIVTQALAFIGVLAVLIAVHELGHMLAAKLLGVRVERFSIGFGPAFWERKYGDTVYQLAAFPIGGYVKIKGMMPDEPESPDSYKSQPGWAKFLIIFMGPFFNFLLAGVFIFVMGFIGVPKFAAQIDQAPDPGTPAAEAGLDRWDMVTEINGEDLITVQDMFRATSRAGESGEPMQLTVEKVEGGTQQISVMPRWDEETGRYLMGVRLHKTQIQRPEVVWVFPGQWADRSGFKIGDQITSVNRHRTETGNEVMLRVISPPEEEPEKLSIDVQRDGESVTLETEQIPASRARQEIGIHLKPILLDKPFGETVQISWIQNVELFQRFTVGIMALIGELAQGSDPGFVGPVGIYSVVGQSTQAGMYSLLMMTVILSINLGLINLFPIPALDGGRIVFIFIDGIIGVFGLKINEKVETLIHTIGFILVLLMMALIIWVDIAREIGTP